MGQVLAERAFVTPLIQEGNLVQPLAFRELECISRKTRSYHSNAYQRRNQLLKEQRQAQKLEEIKRNQLEVELFENKCDIIKSIHKECETPIDWEEVRHSPPPFHFGQTGPKEEAAIEKLEQFKPGFFSKPFNQDEKNVKPCKRN